MPRRGLAALAVTTVALILLLSFKTPAEALPSRAGTAAIVEPGASAATGGTTGSTAGGTTSGGTAGKTPGATASPTPSTKTTNGSTKVTGSVVSTRYGPVQVQVIVAGGHVTDVVALQLPSGRHSGDISNYSAPILREEALSAQSAAIDTVSGATYTSDAYAQSLQAALDKAGIA